MKYVKMLGLAVVAAMALMAFVGAGTASATTVTSPAGTVYKGPILATSTGKPTLTGGFKNIECNKSSVGGEIESQGDTVTAKGPVTTLTFEECNCEVVVVTKGSLEIHTIGAGPNGTLTSNGGEVTVNCSTIFGTVHCIYVTENDDLGTVEGGETETRKTGTIQITVSIRRKTTNSLCAEESVWHAHYTITKPDPIYFS